VKKTARILSVIERVSKVNRKGVSRRIPLDTLGLIALGCNEREASMFQCTNGVPYLRKNSLICKKYHIEKFYKKNTGALKCFRLTGFNVDKTLSVSRTIPFAVRRDVFEKYQTKCIWCGSSDNLEVDHKNGRYTSAGSTLKDFQLLCKSCNDKKRERCKKCLATGTRYNVQSAISSVLYTIPFTKGTSRFNNKLGCTGCFLYDIEDFYYHNQAKGHKHHKHHEHQVEITLRSLDNGDKKGKKLGRVTYHKKIVL
jgi:hypothetical protein